MRRFLIFILVCALAAPIGAGAKDCPPVAVQSTGSSAKDNIYVRRRAEMAPLDTDCDQTVSLAEWGQYFNGRFDSADVNHDGMLSPDEQKVLAGAGSQTSFGAVTIRRSGEIGLALREMLQAAGGSIAKTVYLSYYDRRFRKMDDNNDGKLSIDEFQSGYEGVRRDR